MDLVPSFEVNLSHEDPSSRARRPKILQSLLGPWADSNPLFWSRTYLDSFGGLPLNAWPSRTSVGRRWMSTHVAQCPRQMTKALPFFWYSWTLRVAVRQTTHSVYWCISIERFNLEPLPWYFRTRRAPVVQKQCTPLTWFISVEMLIFWTHYCWVKRATSSMFVNRRSGILTLL